VIICLTTQGRDLDAAMDTTFGRAAFFLFVDDAEMKIVEIVENTPSAHGAGVQAAQIVAQRKVDALITAHVGPNAYSGLAAAGVEILAGITGTARETIDAYRAGRLERITGATSAGHGGGRR